MPELVDGGSVPDGRCLSLSPGSSCKSRERMAQSSKPSTHSKPAVPNHSHAQITPARFRETVRITGRGCARRKVVLCARSSLLLAGERKRKEKKVLYACKLVALAFCAAQTGKAASLGQSSNLQRRVGRGALSPWKRCFVDRKTTTGRRAKSGGQTASNDHYLVDDIMLGYDLVLSAVSKAHAWYRYAKIILEHYHHASTRAGFSPCWCRRIPDEDYHPTTPRPHCHTYLSKGASVARDCQVALR